MAVFVNVGNMAASLDVAPAFLSFTGVRLWYDDEHAFFAGDETGRVLEADCPWATQAIADSVLASVSGYIYKPFVADSALLDPAAELGDAVSVGDVSSVLASIDTTFDAMLASNISAPSDEEINHEYPYLSPQERQLARKVTLGADYYGTRITRKNGLEVVTTKADGTEAARVVLNSDTLAFYNNDGSEALYFDASAGKYRFVGDVSITGGTMNINDNFIVDANGNLTINGNINLSGGSITWGKNDPGGGLTEDEVLDLIDENSVSLPNYIKSSYIASTEIQSPQIKGNEISVYGTFQTIGFDEVNEKVTGYVGAARGYDAMGNLTLGVALSHEWNSDSYQVGENYAIVTNGGVRLQAGTNRVVVTANSISLNASNGDINLNTGSGKAYYNSVEIGSGASGDVTVTPVWG